MKIAVYCCREDERELFRHFGEALEVQLVLSPEVPTLKNVNVTDGCQAVSVVTTSIDAPLIEAWKSNGVKIISTRSIGYEHIDYEHAAALGIAVSNVGYTANTVAEYAVMSILMVLRKMKTIMNRSIGQDYTLRAVRGRELHGMTVGVIGTGRIGERVIAILAGFGCRILAYDLREKDSVKALAEYTSLEEIWRQCDIITLHTPATDDTHHLINGASISRMKDGVIIVNTARGSLIDTSAFIHALESGKIGAAALDVVEHEMGIYTRDFKYKPVKHHDMAVLNAMPNVLMTPHTAFFTDEAVSDMIRVSLESCVRTIRGEHDPWRIN